MTSVDEIINSVNSLSEDELEQLAEIDFDDSWDREIESDVAAGRLDHSISRAEADIASGRTKPLDEVLAADFRAGVVRQTDHNL